MVFDVPHWIQQNQAVHATHVTLSPGGKALNQAVAASRLGADVALIGAVGADLFGREMVQALQQEGVDSTHVQQLETARTSIASIVVKDHVPGFIGAPDASKKLTEAHVRAGLSNLSAGDVLLVNFEIPQPLVQTALEIGRAAGALTVLNPAPYFSTDAIVMSYLHLIDIIIPNRSEARLLTGSQSEDTAELAKILLELGVQQVVLTNGEAGSLYLDRQRHIKQPAFVVDVVDTTGASDAFVGAFCVGLVQQHPIEQTLEFASAAAAIACQMRGTMASMPTLQAVMTLLAN
jgi:ribokinase